MEGEDILHCSRAPAKLVCIAAMLAASAASDAVWAAAEALCFVCRTM